MSGAVLPSKQSPPTWLISSSPDASVSYCVEVALSTQQEYADQLVDTGELGDDEVFSSVVSEADDAQGVFFLRLDDEWRALLQDVAKRDESARPVVEDLDVLRAVGLSTWVDGDTGHLELKVATR